MDSVRDGCSLESVILCIVLRYHLLRVRAHVVAYFLYVRRSGQTNEVSRLSDRAQHVFLSGDRVIRAIMLHCTLEVC